MRAEEEEAHKALSQSTENDKLRTGKEGGGDEDSTKTRRLSRSLFVPQIFNFHYRLNFKKHIIIIIGYSCKRVRLFKRWPQLPTKKKAVLDEA